MAIKLQAVTLVLLVTAAAGASHGCDICKDWTGKAYEASKDLYSGMGSCKISDDKDMAGMYEAEAACKA